MASLPNERAQQYRAAQGQYLMMVDDYRLSNKYGFPPRYDIEWLSPYFHENQLFNRLFSLFKTTSHSEFTDFMIHLTQQQFIHYLYEHPFQRDVKPEQISLTMKVLKPLLRPISESCSDETFETSVTVLEPIVDVVGIQQIAVSTVQDEFVFNNVDVINLNDQIVLLEASSADTDVQVGAENFDFDEIKKRTESAAFSEPSPVHTVELGIKSVFSIYGCRLLLYAPPFSGKSTFLYEHNARICKKCADIWRDKLDFNVYHKHNKFIADTDDIMLWTFVPNYIITNIPKLIQEVECSISIVPEYKEFINRCIIRGLKPEYQWYIDMVNEAQYSGIRVNSNKYVSDIMSQLSDILRLQN